MIENKSSRWQERLSYLKSPIFAPIKILYYYFQSIFVFFLSTYFYLFLRKNDNSINQRIKFREYRYSLDDLSFFKSIEVSNLLKAIDRNIKIKETKCKVLDLGCGDGKIFDFIKTKSRIFKKISKNSGMYYGVDISKCDTHNIYDFVYNQNLEEKLKDLKPKSINIIILICVIEHIENIKKLIKNIRYYLKPSGYLIFSSPLPNIESFHPHSKFLRIVGFKQLAYKEEKRLLEQCYHCSVYSKNEWIYFFKNYNLVFHKEFFDSHQNLIFDFLNYDAHAIPELYTYPTIELLKKLKIAPLLLFPAIILRKISIELLLSSKIKNKTYTNTHQVVVFKKLK